MLITFLVPPLMRYGRNFGLFSDLDLSSLACCNLFRSRSAQLLLGRFFVVQPFCFCSGGLNRRLQPLRDSNQFEGRAMGGTDVGIVPVIINHHSEKFAVVEAKTCWTDSSRDVDQSAWGDHSIS
jgi:hypothetical protein